MLLVEWRTGLRMSGFIRDNGQISVFQTGPGLVARDLWFFRKHKGTVDLAVSCLFPERNEGLAERDISEIPLN